MKKRTFLIAAAALVLSVQAAGVSTATAATPTVADPKILTVTPAATRPTIKPGETVKGNFQIVNQGSVAYKVRIYAAPYTVHGEEYTPDFKPISGKPSVESWLRFGTSDADINKGENHNVSYTISVPTGTTPGGYYAVAFVETEPTDSKHGVVVNERVGEIFYIQVAGKVTEVGKLNAWSSPFLQKQPLTADLRLENDGGLHYASNIQLVVRDIFGRPKYTLATEKEILPQTVRHTQLRWDKSPPLGFFKVTGSATIPEKTIQLPTKYVLIMSPLVRIIFLAVIGVSAAWVAGRYAQKMRQKRKAKT